MPMKKRANWGSRMGFILATVGSAVGLGNVWRFPTVVAENGGGAFVLLYLLMVLLIGLPTMVGELTLGRAGNRNVVGVFSQLTTRMHKWWLIGILPILASFAVLSFYTVVAGWSLLYVFSSLAGITADLGTTELEKLFNFLTGNVYFPILGQFVFMALTVSIVIIGVRKGIERYVTFLMPAVVLLMLILFARTLFLEGAWEGIGWFFRPELQQLSFNTALEAVGQVFFSFSLGMGAIIIYGSYLGKDSNIPMNSILISGADVGVALLSGLIVIPSLFAFGISPETGPGLIFVTLPAIFNTFPGSILWTTIFFLLLTFAALTSAVSLLEVIVSYLKEERKWSRSISAIFVGGLIFVVSIFAGLSQGPYEEIALAGMNFFNFLDFTASNILLPLGGLCIVLFIGWVWGTQQASAEITRENRSFKWAAAWSILIRYLVPISIGYILISGLLF